MSSAPDRDDYETFEDWVTALAAYSDSDPMALVDEILSQIDQSED